MRKAIIAFVVGLLAITAFAAETQTSIPREGKLSGTKVTSGTLQAVPLGADQARLSYDAMGVELGEGSILHNASVRCLGTMTVANGSFEDESGVCVYTRPDGDQVFTAHRGGGKVGGEAKGTWKFIGGTGKFAGIQGSGEWTRYVVRRAAEGTTQAVAKSWGTYKLPTTTAER